MGHYTPKPGDNVRLTINAIALDDGCYQVDYRATEGGDGQIWLHPTSVYDVQPAPPPHFGARIHATITCSACDGAPAPGAMLVRAGADASRFPWYVRCEGPRPACQCISFRDLDLIDIIVLDPGEPAA